MTSDQATVGAFLLGALAALASSAIWLWPRVKGFFMALDRMFETINGRPAKVDKAGRQQSPAIPSLGVQLADLTSAVSDQATQNARLTALETTAAEHGQRLTAIEAGHQIERSLGHVASAKTFDAIEAVARKGEPVEEPDTEL